MKNIFSKIRSVSLFNYPFRGPMPRIITPQITTFHSPLTFNSRFSYSVHAVHKNIIKSNYQASGYYVQQLFTGCLAIYSYYLESGNDCFLIDPLFDTQQYIDLIKSRGKTLKGIFISHYHADYVSGQHELQKKYNCKIYMGPKSIPTETVVSMKDKEILKFGNVLLQCWHTPGHTEESSCLVVIDDKAKRDTIFTGDTIFLNEVGRPDLAVKTDLSAHDLAGMLFQSLQRIKTLNNDIRIYPGHGSGSACGKSIGKGDFCSLGTQKQNNYGLQADKKSDFIEKVLNQMPNPPKYFGYNAKINKFQPFFYELATKAVQKQLTPQEVATQSKNYNTIVIDIRNTEQLKDGIIQGALCIGFDGGFANWVGTLLDPKDQLIIFGNEHDSKEAITRLFRIGYINIIGYAGFSIKDWKQKALPTYNPEFYDNIAQHNATILDVRKPGEWKSDGVIDGSVRMQLGDLFAHPEKLDKSKTYITHCKSGYRAKIAWSFLAAQGFKVKAYPYPFDTIFKSGKVKNVPL